MNIYKNVLVIVVGMLVLQFIFNSVYFTYVAVIVGVGSLLHSKIASFINFIWLKIAEGLGWVNSRILLGAIFYLFLCPLALLTRLFKRNMLNLKKPVGTVFDDRHHTYQKEDLENIW